MPNNQSSPTPGVSPALKIVASEAIPPGEAWFVEERPVETWDGRVLRIGMDYRVVGKIIGLPPSDTTGARG